MVMFSIDKESNTVKGGAPRPPATAKQHGSGSSSGDGPTGSTTGHCGPSPVGFSGRVPGGTSVKLPKIPESLNTVPPGRRGGGQVSLK